MDVTGPVLLFDGECGLCMRCVKFLLAIDRAERLCFAPLQGDTAQAFLRARGLATEDFSSAIFVPAWPCRFDLPWLSRTDALLASLATVGGLWRILAWLRVLPRPWRDAIYLWVARRRRRLFGPAKGKALWSSYERRRFLL
jgi:predicted DCC family thiol-disulfide oxidoreductase YuxK